MKSVQIGGVIAAVTLVLASAGQAHAVSVRIDPNGRQVADCRGGVYDPNGRGGAYDPNGKGLGVDPNGRCAGVTAASTPGEFPWQLGGKVLSFLFGWLGLGLA